MSSVRRGTQALLLEECPLVVYTHCRAHCLNLAIVHSCDQPLIRNMLGTLKETCNFFKYSPKRNNLLLCVIEKDSPDAKKTTLKNMCKTRWVERHEAYEVFFALFLCIMRALEVMANERLFAGQCGDAAWSWDIDTKNKASGLANAISSFSFIITLLTAMECLSVLKPLSVKLRKRDLDVYEANTHSNKVTDDLQDIQDNIEDIWTEWFDLAVTTAANVGVVPSIPSRTNQQQHRDNVPAQTPSDYYKRAVAILLLDHLQSEMKTYFNPTNDAVLSSLFNLLPELVAVGDRNPNIEAALDFYENDLPSPHVVDVELLRWKGKWCSTEDADLPTSAVQTLAACDREFFPNIHTLIRILYTLPITSAECERSFSTLRRLKTYLRSTMSSERESGLALMNINYHRDINIEEVINTFAQRQPRRFLFA